MLLFLVGCMIFGYMEKEEKAGAAYTAQKSTVRRIKAQLEQYVVSSDLVENIIQTGYQLMKKLSNLASVIPNENGIIKAFELVPDGIITDVYPK